MAERKGRAIAMLGMRFGRLVVLSRADNHRTPSGTVVACWNCLCDCGGTLTVQGPSLRTQNTRSCGCLIKQRRPPRLRHGESVGNGTPEYRTWCHIISRCTDPGDARYELYGARGITVCKEWRESYEQFLHDVGRRPARKHSIDRKDNDGNYEPGNVRWATQKEQCHNQRTNVVLTHNGKTMCLAEWAEEVNKPATTLYWRNSQGWTTERILLTPLRKHGQAASQ